MLSFSGHPSPSDQRLERLRRVRDLLEARGGAGQTTPPSRADGGRFRDLLSRAATHEWFVSGSAGVVAPLGLLINLARSWGTGPALWIGERCWPSGIHRCEEVASVFRAAVLVDASRREDRLWAADTALRCPGVCAVVADGGGFTMAQSRRLQLSAEVGGTIGFLVRPIDELTTLSAAQTRWRLAPLPTRTPDPQWTLELLRCKGVRPVEEEARRWVVRWCHATSDVHLVPDVRDRTADEIAAPCRSAG